MGDRAQRLLLGDWSRLLRDPIDLIRLSFPVGVVVLALLGNVGETVRMAAAAALVFFARTINLPRPVDLMLCLGVAVEVWGHSLGLYKSVVWYDEVVHFLLPFFVSPLAYITLSRLEIVPDLQEEARGGRFIGIFLITFSVMTAFGAALWEVFEYVCDMLLGTSLSFGYADAVGDMAATMGGSALGSLWLVVWASRSWGTTRRPRPRPSAQARTEAA